MRKEKEIREKIYKKLDYVLKEKDHNKMMIDLAWINALNWVLDTEKMDLSKCDSTTSTQL